MFWVVGSHAGESWYLEYACGPVRLRTQTPGLQVMCTNCLAKEFALGQVPMISGGMVT